MPMGDKNSPENTVVAIATVIQVEAPTSAKPGDKALIHRDGVVEGWVGGGCVQPAVNSTSLAVVNSGQPCLLRVAPDGKWEPVEGLNDYASSCLGGGSVLLFIEPLGTQPSLYILGESAVAQSLAELSIHMNFNVNLLRNNNDMKNMSSRIIVRTDFDCANADFIVIATQGKGDKQAIASALQSNCPHIRMVVSARKLEALKAQLQADGMDDESLARIDGPAGIDINARSPQEIALSVLAEVVKIRRSTSASLEKSQAHVRHTDENEKPVASPSDTGSCCD